MLKQITRWLVAMLALTLIALAALLSPILSSHATAPHHISGNAIQQQYHDVTPNAFWMP
ncbi:MAG: hypothetical protein NVS4B11_15650 [Ktedonobacteraceae bacterium]